MAAPSCSDGDGRPMATFVDDATVAVEFSVKIRNTGPEDAVNPVLALTLPEPFVAPSIGSVWTQYFFYMYLLNQFPPSLSLLSPSLSLPPPSFPPSLLTTETMCCERQVSK